jgi:conjugal transfer pilus assembly protein TrbC
MQKLILSLVVVLVASCSAFAEGPLDEEQIRTLLERAGKAVKTQSADVLSKSPALSADERRDYLDKASKNLQPYPSGVIEAAEERMKQYMHTPNFNSAVNTAQTKALNNGPGADPAKIADMYRRLSDQSEPGNARDELLIFVSTSIPPETLKVLGANAKRFGATLVLRGLVNGLTNDSFTKTAQLMSPATNTGASLMIHPELFKRYHIHEVPAVVLTHYTSGGCADDFCAQYLTFVGDVGLDYILEQYAKKPGKMGELAREHLAQGAL